MQLAKSRAKTAGVNSRARAHNEEILLVMQQKLFGLMTCIQTVALSILERLRQHRHPELPLGDRRFNFIATKNACFTPANDFHVRPPCDSPLFALSRSGNSGKAFGMPQANELQYGDTAL